MANSYIEYEESDETGAARKLNLCFMCATKRAMEAIIAGKQNLVKTSIVTTEQDSFMQCNDCTAYFN
jgi:hypothetical protein